MPLDFASAHLSRKPRRLPHSYIDQGGGCLIAYAHSQPAGFVAWRALPETVAPKAWELKRLWVRPQARGLNLGRALTQAVLDRAIETGRRAVYLDTAPAAMATAHRLYLDQGFEPCSAYNDNPVEGLAWMRKTL